VKCVNAPTIHLVKEPIKNMTFILRFCVVLSGIEFGLGSCTFFTFGFSSVVNMSQNVGKTLILVRFVLAGFRFFAISNNYFIIWLTDSQ